MSGVEKRVGFLIGFLLVATASAEVRVFLQDSNSVAWVRYECTAGEVVRSFALDVAVDKGRIVGISDYFRGPSTAAQQGYGIFPASFRDHIALGPETNVNWNVIGYSPLAVTADSPTNTLPGLNTSGVTLEFGSLWDANVPEAVPRSTGTLCSLRISQRATVSVSANAIRGGVVGTEANVTLTAVFTGAMVQPPEISSLSLTNGILTIVFAGGKLEYSSAITGPWTATEDSSGRHTESVGDGPPRFYRVRSP
jgi:hypothetical protein